MRGRDVKGKLFDQSRQSGSLSFGKLEHEPGQGGRVDDGMLERALQATADEPRVESVVAVLNQHGTVSKTQEGTACVAKLRRADEHRTVDVVAPVGVWIDRRLAVDQRVEERQRAVEAEPLGTDLEDEERRVAGGLHVEGDELCLVELRQRPKLGCVDRNLLPGHWLHGSARLEENRFHAVERAHLDSAIARRAQAISSPVNPRRRRTAAP